MCVCMYVSLFEKYNWYYVIYLMVKCLQQADRQKSHLDIQTDRK